MPPILLHNGPADDKYHVTFGTIMALKEWISVLDYNAISSETK